MATILTVDDSPSVRQVVRIVLEGAGHTVVEAGNGQEGLSRIAWVDPRNPASLSRETEQGFVGMPTQPCLAKATPVDLVITDLNMPVMNGLDLIRALRTTPSAMGVPIVFLTTESNDAVKQQAKAAGATGWITKPFKPEQILAVATKLIRK